MTKLYLILSNETERTAIVLSNVDTQRLLRLKHLCEEEHDLAEVRINFDDFELRAIDSFPVPPTDGVLGNHFAAQAAQAEPGDGADDDDFRIECCQLAIDRYGNVQFHALPKHYNDPLSTEVVSLQEILDHG